MKSVYELLRDNFERWELRGRGVLTFPGPVSPKPPFAPFPGHRVPQLSSGVDSSRSTKVSGFLQRAKERIRGTQPAMAQVEEQPRSEEIEPDWCGKEMDWIELGLRVPPSLHATRESMSALFAGLSMASDPLSFEIVANSYDVFCQWAVSSTDSRMLSQQMKAHFPEVKVSARQGRLQQVWEDCSGVETAFVEFGLAEYFMWPLAESKVDSFVSLIGALADLSEGEAAVYQVLFEPADETWAQAAMQAVSKADGKPFFDDGADLQKATREKVRGPLYGVVLRMASRAGDAARAWDIIREVAPALRLLSNPAGNEFFPLLNDDLDEEEREDDLLGRRSHRCGMLLNQQELLGLVHLPSPAVFASRFERLSVQTRPAPLCEGASGAVSIGRNSHDGTTNEVWLNREQRLRHTHIIGGTGTGKTTLLLHMIRQDMERGEGFAVIDPHGDLITDVLGMVPEHRKHDVVLVDPSDEEFSVGFNILTASSEFEKTQLASDLVSVFRRTSTSWGDQMNSVLANAVQVFLDLQDGGTLADLRRFLLEPDFRQSCLERVSDVELVYYWQHTFPQLGGSKSLGPILTRLENFLSPKPVRYMVAQKSRCLDIGALMDQGKILLARLPQGLIGRENGQLLGSLLVMRLQLAAINRQRSAVSERRPFWLYIDEFQDFITQSMAEILTGARKYGLGMVLAHQQLGQLQRNDEVAASVLANCCTRIVFRCGDDDSRYLERGFTHFTAKDIQSLATGSAIVRLERGDQDFNLEVPLFDGRHPAAEEARRQKVIALSRQNHARPRQEIESELRASLSAALSAAEPRSRKDPPASQAQPAESPPATAETPPVVKMPPPANPQFATPAAEPLTEPPAKTIGMGRGGSDHQWLVEQFCRQGSELGFRASKEHEVPGGRVDVVLEKRGVRIAIEVAVNSNTSHELDNLRKCLEAGFEFVVSVSPLSNVVSNIETAAKGAFSESERQRLRFQSPELLHLWLEEIASQHSDVEPPASPAERRIAGRRVKIKQVTMSREERVWLEHESLAAIADLISKKKQAEG